MSPEVRQRVQAALKAIGEAGHPSPATRRNLWVVEILEQLGTRDARAFLKELAAGEPKAWLTLEAKASLHRLAKDDESNP